MKQMTRYMGAVLLASITIFAVGEPYEIALVGMWDGSEGKMTPDDDWWGISPEGDGFTLQHAPVSVTAAHAPMSDGKGEMTGKKVSVEGEAKPLILLRGLKKPVRGPLVTGTIVPGSHWVRDVKKLDRYISPGETLHLTADGAQWNEKIRISALAEVKEESKYHQVTIYNYQLRLYQGIEANTISQVFFTHPQIRDLGRPHLMWTGDLDRDGKLDFLFDISDHYIITHLALYLSSEAKEGELVGMVAEWIHYAC